MNADLLHYTLQCQCCGKEYLDSFDEGFLLTCPQEHPPALLKTIYTQATFEVQPELPGMFRYAHWLPVWRTLKTAPLSIVYQSKGLGHRLGLENLWVAFNGYWPEKGALMESCTFKELEAPPVCARIPEDEKGTLIVASAGNTARAFLQVCSEHAMPVVVVVPEVGLPWLWMTRERHPCTKIVVLSDADYFDAIRLGNRLAGNPDFWRRCARRPACRHSRLHGHRNWRSNIRASFGMDRRGLHCCWQDNERCWPKSGRCR